MNLENLIIFFVTNVFRTSVNLHFLEVFLDKDSKNRLWQYFAFFVCFGITSAGYLLFHNREVNIVTNVLGLLLMALVFQGNLNKKWLAVCFIYIVNMMCDVIVILLFPDYGVNLQINELQGTMTTFLILICETVIKKFIYVKRLSNFISPHWAILLLIPMCSMGMIHILVNTSLINRMVIVTEGIGLLIINIIVFYLYSVMEDSYLEKMEKEIAVQTSKIYEHQLDVIMNSQEIVRSLQHDLKYHIRELIAMAEAEQMQDMILYLNEMNSQSGNSEEYVYSGNKEIDGNLNYLLSVAKGKLKDVAVKIAVPEGKFISSFDINVIISNLLDNAITAAINSEDKRLLFEMSVEKSLLYITISNSYSGEISEKKGRFITIKADNTKHGYGMKNVERIIRKYNGTMDIDYKDRKFYVNIMMYLSNVID